jgi:lipopolysaccharide transport system permease protein
MSRCTEESLQNLATETQTGSTRVTVSINRPSKVWGFPDLPEIWRYRELLLSLVERELRVRYKQTVLGAIWVILQPLLTMLIFTLFFSHLVTIPIGNVSYAVFIYTALVPWIYFSNTLTRLGSGLLEQQSIITKVYFPRLLIPLSSLVAGLVDLGLAILVLAALLAFYRITPPTTVWAAPLFLAFTVLAAFSFGIWLAALNVEYRDVGQVIPFLIQIWFFATPIIYPAVLIRPSLRFLYGLNPMAVAVEGFRWSVLGVGTPPGHEAWISLAATLVVLGGGLVYFRQAEDSFADVV